MGDWEIYIRQIWEKLPEICKSSDLVRAGLYKSDAAACVARKTGKCPSWIRIPGRGICYPRSAVIDFLRTLEFGTPKKK